MAGLLPQGEDIEILGDDWTVGEADLCHRLTRGCSVVGHARYTGGQYLANWEDQRRLYRGDP